MLNSAPVLFTVNIYQQGSLCEVKTSRKSKSVLDLILPCCLSLLLLRFEHFCNMLGSKKTDRGSVSVVDQLNFYFDGGL